MPQIFICYSRENQDIVKVLAKDIEELGHNVWLDHELIGGQAWWDKILDEICKCEVFVFSLSQEALYSQACKCELNYASDLGKTILPIMVVDGVSINLLPANLSIIQHVDYRQQDKQAVIAVNKSINNLSASMSLPNPLPEPPGVPISYLGNLKVQIETTEALNFEKQAALILKFEESLRKDNDVEDLCELLNQFQERDDLYAKIGKKIDDLLTNIKVASQSQESDFINGESTTKPLDQEKDEQIKEKMIHQEIQSNTEASLSKTYQEHLSMSEPEVINKPKSENVRSSSFILEGHRKSVNDLAFSPDGKLLASCSGGIFWSGDCSVRLWRVSDGKLVRTLEGHKDRVESVTFSPDGKILASTSISNTWLWQVSDGARLSTLENVTIVRAFSPDFSTLVTAGFDNYYSLWSVSNVKCLGNFDLEEDERYMINHAVFSQDGSDIALGMRAVAFSPDGANLVSGPRSKTRVRRSSDGKIQRIFEITDKMDSSEPCTAYLLRISDGKILLRFKLGIDEDDSSINSVMFSPDGTTVAVGLADKTVRIWRVSDGELLFTLKGHKKEVNSVAFSPDGAMLVSGSEDKTIRLWQVR